VPGDVLAVDVLDDEVGWTGAVEPSGVVDVDEPGVVEDGVDDAPVAGGVGASVGVVVDPLVAVEVLLSAGATGLTPPLPGAVEMPPVARSLTLTGVVVVIEVEVCADAPGLTGAFAESPLATPAGDCGRATSGEADAVGAE
jgi:hypothetical protein